MAPRKPSQGKKRAKSGSGEDEAASSSDSDWLVDENLEELNDGGKAKGARKGGGKGAVKAPADGGQRTTRQANKKVKYTAPESDDISDGGGDSDNDQPSGKRSRLKPSVAAGARKARDRGTAADINDMLHDLEDDVADGAGAAGSGAGLKRDGGAAGPTVPPVVPVSFRPSNRSRKNSRPASGMEHDTAELDGAEQKPTTASEEEEEEEEEEEDEEGGSGELAEDDWDSHCSVCQKDNQVTKLLCCESCVRVYHIYCLTPPLPKVPKGDWHCPHCMALLGLQEIERVLDVRTVPATHPVGETLMTTLDSDKQHLHARSRQQAAAASPQGGKREPGAAGSAAGAKAEGAAEGEAGATRREYLVKWKGFSYPHCKWIAEDTLVRASKLAQPVAAKMKRFQQLKQEGRSLTGDAEGDADDITGEFAHGINTQWVVVERVVAASTGLAPAVPGIGILTEEGKGKDKPKAPVEGPLYLVKWKELGYEMCTWEPQSMLVGYEAELAAFHARRSIMEEARERRERPETLEAMHRSALERARQEQAAAANGSGLGGGTRKYLGTPEWLSTGGELHPYQIEGLNWLYHHWCTRENVILADEMGLGKTVQAISLLAALHWEEFLGRPHLVVVPLSTLRNWEREFATWAPYLNVVTLNGNQDARKVIMDRELYTVSPRITKKTDRASLDERIKFHVLLTTYEMLLAESSALNRAAQWGVLIVDEGHRLKTKTSRLFSELQGFKPTFTVLLTGTPLQNNIGELFMLMHFLEPAKFTSQTDFEAQFSDLGQKEQVGALHALLEPHLLRRLKKDVLKKLPPKQEQVIRVELSDMQKEFYKSLLARHYPVLAGAGGPGAGHTTSALKNLMMQLRKCCNHPYLFDGADPGSSGDPAASLKHFVDSSGKLALLDRLLAKLLARGHRMLIYSQFTSMLDILEDWLQAKALPFLRIDGTIPGAERQRRIDRFNRHPDQYSIFLLSTRAGGVGINLATADTVIIYDSDWNPHNDLQAQARAHRLGQTRPVMIYRLVTRATIEERMMQVSRKKLVLEHLVVRKMGAAERSGKAGATLNQSDLDDILRYGVKELFQEDEALPAAEPPGEGQAPGTAPASGAAAPVHSRRIVYDEEALEKLLDRSELQAKGEGAAEEAEEDELFKGFKVANFNMVVDEAPTTRAGSGVLGAAEAAAKQQPGTAELLQEICPDQEEAGGAAFWSGLLADQFQEIRQEQFASMGRGRRKRGQVQYNDEGSSSTSGSSDADDDEEFKAEDAADAEESDEGVEVVEESDDEFTLLGKGRGRKPSGGASGPAAGGAAGAGAGRGKGARHNTLLRQMEESVKQQQKAQREQVPPMMSGAGSNLQVHGFNDRERGIFMVTFLRFGLPADGHEGSLQAALNLDPLKPDMDLEKLKELYQPFMQRLPDKPLSHLVAYSQQLVRCCCRPGPDTSPTFPNGLPKAALLGVHKPNDVMSRVGHMHIVRRKVAEIEGKAFTLDESIITATVGDKLKTSNHWTRLQDGILLKAVLLYGLGNYKRMLQDEALGLLAAVLAHNGASANVIRACSEALKPPAARAQTQPDQSEQVPPEVINASLAGALDWLTHRMLNLIQYLDRELSLHSQQTQAAQREAEAQAQAQAQAHMQGASARQASGTGTAAHAAAHLKSSHPLIQRLHPTSGVDGTAGQHGHAAAGNGTTGPQAMAQQQARATAAPGQQQGAAGRAGPALLPQLSQAQLLMLPPDQRAMYLQQFRAQQVQQAQQAQQHLQDVMQRRQAEAQAAAMHQQQQQAMHLAAQQQIARQQQAAAAAKQQAAVLAAQQQQQQQQAKAAASQQRTSASQAAGGAGGPTSQQQQIAALAAQLPMPPVTGNVTEIPPELVAVARDTPAMVAKKRALIQMYNGIVAQLNRTREETATTSASLDPDKPEQMQEAAAQFREQVGQACRLIEALMAALPRTGTIAQELQAAAQPKVQATHAQPVQPSQAAQQQQQPQQQQREQQLARAQAQQEAMMRQQLFARAQQAQAQAQAQAEQQARAQQAQAHFQAQYQQQLLAQQQAHMQAQQQQHAQAQQQRQQQAQAQQQQHAQAHAQGQAQQQQQPTASAHVAAAGGLNVEAGLQQPAQAQEQDSERRLRELETMKAHQAQALARQSHSGPRDPPQQLPQGQTGVSHQQQGASGHQGMGDDAHAGLSGEVGRGSASVHDNGVPGAVEGGSEAIPLDSRVETVDLTDTP